MQAGLDFQDDISSARGDEWDITHELEGVAQALLGVQQNS